MINNISKSFTSIISNLNYFHSLEVVNLVATSEGKFQLNNLQVKHVKHVKGINDHNHYEKKVRMKTLNYKNILWDSKV